MVIFLMTIDGYYIGGHWKVLYWWVLEGILLVGIERYYIDGY